MKVPILSGNVAIVKHRCWHAYAAWRRIDWIINVVIKTFALNKNGDDLSIAYNIIKPKSSASWKCNGPRFIFTRPYRRLIRLRLLTYLRIPVVSEILDLYTTASMYPAISTADLLNIPVTLPTDKKIVNEVVSKIQKSRQARQEAKRPLAEARSEVEKPIER